MKGCRPLSPEEIQTVLEELEKGRHPYRDRALFLLGLRTGFRISELLSLRLRDVVQNGQIVEEITVQRKHMKKKREGRTIPLHLEAKLALEAWVKKLSEAGLSEGDSYIFGRSLQNASPLHRISAWRILKRAFFRAGLTGKLATHTMRKTFAKRIYNETGCDIMTTKEALGQRDLSTTQMYLSFDKSKLKNAILKS